MNAGTTRRRVLHLIGASEDHGGILSVVRSLSTGWHGDDWEHVLWMHSRFLQTRQPALPCRYSPSALDESPSHLRLLVAAWKSWPGLLRLRQAEGFHLLHAHSRGSLPLAWLARRRRIPVLFTNHAYARRTGLYRAAVRSGLPMVLLTPAMARHYRIDPSPGRVELISACVADRFFGTPLPAPTPPESAGPLRLVGIGNIVRWKQWDLLVEAIRRLSSEARARIQATVWGPVPGDRDARQFHEELRGAVRDHGLERQIRFAGPSQNIADILARSDWFVLPSANEPCSVALMEALASGIPAVASASGGNVDLVADGQTGALFRPNDPESLGQTLAAILDGRIRPRSPEGIRDSVRARSARCVAGDYRRFYNHLVDTGGPA